MLVPFDLMKQTIKSAFINSGMSPERAEICAQIHTETSCDGVYSHGLNRVPRFCDYLKKGWVNPEAFPTFVSGSGSLEIYDGNLGPGITNGIFAIDRAMQLADEHTVGVVALKNTTHWMRGGTYGWRAANKGYLALLFTNTESTMPPWGGKDIKLGNNPFIMAAPYKDQPVVLDMAMSLYTFGKLDTTRLKLKELPFPGGFDSDGNLTSNPALIEKSMRVLPIGYWKGSAMAIMLDLFSAMLSGGMSTAEIDKVKKGSCTGCCQTFIAIKPDVLISQERLEQIVEETISHIKTSEPSNKNTSINYPGESTLKRREENLKNGIPVDEGVWNTVCKLASPSKLD